MHPCKKCGEPIDNRSIHCEQCARLQPSADTTRKPTEPERANEPGHDAQSATETAILFFVALAIRTALVVGGTIVCTQFFTSGHMSLLTSCLIGLGLATVYCVVDGLLSMLNKASAPDEGNEGGIVARRSNTKT